MPKPPAGPAEAPGLVAVMAREVRWIAADRLALLLVLAIPLIAFALLAATFGHAVVRGLKWMWWMRTGPPPP